MTDPATIADPCPIPKVGSRDIYEVANQLGGYVGPGTPDDLARFLLREAEAATALADEIVRLTASLSAEREARDEADDEEWRESLSKEAARADHWKARAEAAEAEIARQESD